MHRLAYVAVATVLTLVGAAPAMAAPLPRSVTSMAEAAHPLATVTAARTAASAATSTSTTAGTGTDVLSVQGAGPYRIGASLDRLTAAGMIDWSVATCDGVVRAGATGAWAGVILLGFRHGRLVEVTTATVPPYSPAGAGVGMTFAQLEMIYGPRGGMISNDAGTATAYLVRVGTRVELFTGHPIRSGVGAFQVGTASFVERAFRQGGTC